MNWGVAEILHQGDRHHLGEISFSMVGLCVWGKTLGAEEAVADSLLEAFLPKGCYLWALTVSQPHSFLSWLTSWTMRGPPSRCWCSPWSAAAKCDFFNSKMLLLHHLPLIHLMMGPSGCWCHGALLRISYIKTTLAGGWGSKDNYPIVWCICVFYCN